MTAFGKTEKGREEIEEREKKEKQKGEGRDGSENADRNFENGREAEGY